jgi:hypothetical protein
MTSPDRRWPMIGPPTRDAVEPSGFSSGQPRPTSTSTTSALAAAVAVVTARQEGLPLTVAELADLVEGADLVDVARQLAELAGRLLDKFTADRGERLLRHIGLFAQEDR